MSTSDNEKFELMLAHEELTLEPIDSAEEHLNAEVTLQALAHARDWRSLFTLVLERGAKPSYRDALRDYDARWEKLLSRNGSFEELTRKSKLVNNSVALPAAQKLREKNLAYRDTYEETMLLNARINEYRKLTARMAQVASLLREDEERRAGTFLSYDDDTLNGLVASGDYEINSPEWHEARGNGIGGSDVGAIMRVDPQYASANYTRVVESKTTAIQPNENDELYSTKDDLTTPIGRGNAWEEFLRYHVQDRHPELRVGFCKTSWHGGAGVEYRHANFDGLFLDADGKPEGILEIKTGSNAKKWGAPELGLDAVPPAYRKQVLWYAANAGFTYGKIIVMLSDYDYREYDFRLDTPAMREEVREMFEVTDRFWSEIQKFRAESANASDSSNRLFRKTNSLSSRVSLDALVEVFSGYADLEKRDAKKRLVNAFKRAEKEKGRELTRLEFQSVVFDVFSEHDPEERTSPFVGIDLETTTTSARTGRIIETGIVKRGESGEYEVAYGTLHGLPERAAKGVGVGATEIHLITLERLEGKPLFEDCAEEILEHLLDSTLVAHNAGFEDRFLSANLPGYVEARRAGRIKILDTFKVTKFLMPRSEDNTLKSFAEDNGIPYEGAHAASQDALMMMRALARLQRTIHNGGHFITRRATETMREGAAQEATLNESSR